VLAEIGIDPSQRAEQIAVDDFLTLAARLEQCSATGAFNASPTR
jgi:16S rRNA A1518/A1519 N6-dimethyltransferase RsmA/KsgA/DIM1 with predicted DNA glycosylase/AP lyase activity